MSARKWRDPSWVGIFSVQNGVDEATRAQRLILFGKNEIAIKGKSTMSLLIDEVDFVILFLQQ
jgi:cation-transporting P-type ATPase 13A2